MASSSKVIEIIKKIADVIGENKEYLTDLDAAIGDSDHGINMNRGFQGVLAKLPDLEGKDIGAILQDGVGKSLRAIVGGSSGPLYGRFFINCGKKTAGMQEIGMDEFLAMFKDGIDGVMKTCQAVKGEKTMLDAMIPAYEAMCAAQAAGKSAGEVFDEGVKAAEAGIEYTKTIIATKGRASYLGERSLGHQDPGATSFTLMLKTVAENI